VYECPQGFQWNEEKAAAIWRDHGVALSEAVRVFRDPLAVEHIDDCEDFGEERVKINAMCDGVVLNVTYTERDDDIQLISGTRGRTI